MAPDPFLARFASLTDRELRMLVLAVEEDLTPSRLSNVLGVSPASVANAMAGIRRKLAVPLRQDLKTFVASTPGLSELVAAIEIPDPPSADVDRRTRDVLRITIAELEALARRASRRAAALGTLTEADRSGVARDEARRINEIAELLDQATHEALAIARRNS